MKNFNTNTDNNEEWLTPPSILKELGPFDLDPAAPVTRPWDMASLHYTKLDDGLAQPWKGRVWLNPPYGRNTFAWLSRLSEHKSGIALIFARTETAGFHAEIWSKAKVVFFFQGRLRFHHATGEQGGTANAPSCLVAYSHTDAARILMAKESGALKGAYIAVD